MTRITLYDYPRSSACYRVRIALNLKRLSFASVRVDLLEGEQRAEDYCARNPQGFVPFLELDGQGFGQSLAIIDRLEAGWPEPPLLPAEAGARAQVLAMALVVACDIHPLNNLRVLKYLSGPLEQPQAARDSWYRHWVSEGLAALESLAAQHAGRFLHGDEPTLADVCLVPQLFNARRFEVPLDPYPSLVRADAEAARLEAFAAAHPDRV
ncbi:MAG: maleylacetoacetate isomerase [Sphingosinicella sp.]